MAKRKQLAISEEMDAAAGGEPLVVGEEVPVANSQSPTADIENASGGEEPEVISDQLPVAEVPSSEFRVSSTEAPAPQPSALPPAPARPQANQYVYVKCVAPQAILDSQMMLKGEVRWVAYGVYRQAWARNAAAFQVKLPGADGYVQETE